ncbi:DUF3987 domain-containing protein [Pseudohoeflea suaedae]|uniref:DUF3987 domain-containing protein n=1 Tax=Pseudohoeflea suaedae TaxID=877384 RepID=A0A4R5PKG3_9HYPH|nr:bifunctional DNA primase/polymerase [Pseudohoeflea suaedae]TDH35704.1 DUF3987 domain-containing protein [Pseudohoeflea suaedae]
MTIDTQKQLALSYAAQGIPVFPCRQGDEDSGDVDPETGEVLFLKAKTPRTSNGFKGASAREYIINTFWDRYPNSMVGIPTGEQIGAWVLDVDVHKDDDGNVINGYETLEALCEKHGDMPDTARATTAGGGMHYYFKHVPGVRNRGALGPGIDVRSSGGYVIAPGSVTADGREYTWVDHDGEGFPPIANAPEWLLSLVLPQQPQGTTPYTHTSTTQNNTYVERAVHDELDALAATAQGGRGEAVNRSAFSLGTIVGAGALSRNEAEAGLLAAARSNGVVAKDGEREIKAKIRRGLDAGIKQPRDIPAPEFEDDGTQPVDFSGMLKPRAAENAPTVEELDDAAEYRLSVVDDIENLTFPGGLVEDLIDWIVSSAEQPSRTLALAAVLPLVGALMGARYSTGTRDTRPNIYTVSLAESGFGKEHARSQIKRLFMADQDVLAKYSGPARIMSASALREVLEHHPYVNCQIDEFGGFVRSITDRNAGGHQQAISTDLRDYYSASSTFFEGAAYRGSPPKRIYNPVLCIHGTSTPDQFWNALSSASAEDGLLPRLILFCVNGDEPEAVVPSRKIDDVPEDLLLRMSAVAGVNVVAARMGNMPQMPPGKAVVKPNVVPWTHDALVTFESIKRAVKQQEAMHQPEHRPFVRRIIENAIKLALIVAVGEDSYSPVVTEANIEWAAALSWTCAASMLEQVSERLSDNQREANYKRIASLVRGAGKKGITVGQLSSRVKQIDARQREELIRDLMEAGKVLIAPQKPTGRPSRRLVWATA